MVEQRMYEAGSKELKLVKPTAELQDAYLEMLEDWKQSGEKMVPWVLYEDPSDFEAMVKVVNGYSQGIGVKETFVPSSTYWLVEEDTKLIGVVNIRHFLNESLKNSGGHIGYGIRPNQRRKGYATRMLALALDIARELGINKALITCDKENLGSAGTIRNNGGVLDSEGVEDGKVFQRYWIEIGS